MPHVAHRAHDDGAAFALALAGIGRDAAHIGDAGNAGNNEHVAVFGEVMRLELGHAIDMGRGVERIGALADVAHGQRRADDQLAGQCRVEHARADHAFRHAELVHDVGDQAGAFTEREEPLDRAGRRFRRRLHADARGCDPAGQFLVGHGGAFLSTSLWELSQHSAVLRGAHRT